MTEPISAAQINTPTTSPNIGDGHARAQTTGTPAPNRPNQEATNWYVRHQDGLDETETPAFHAWLAQDPSHQLAFDRITHTWQRLGNLPADNIATLKAMLPTPVHQATPDLPQSRKRRTWLIGMAGMMPRMAMTGVAASVAGGGLLGWHYLHNPPLFHQTYATARGQQIDVVLPDGSQLTLDTDTHADVKLYKDRREVHLTEGQAMFTVTADASRPFDVLAGSVRVTVVGTRFSVRNTKTGLNPGGVSVIVEEGRVRVTPEAASIVELTAGQSFHSDANGQTTAKTTSGAAIVWREGRVNFDRTPLPQALAEFERYGASLPAINDLTVKAMRINGSFDLHQADAFINALPLVLPVRIAQRIGATEIVPIR